MARHSHWAQIKLKKGALDKKRGKIFTQHARLIEIAARAGGDPDTNPSLRLAIDNARSDNFPNDNIERAIKKGTGELKEGMQMEEVIYEAYGPNGVAIVIETLTENKNRTGQQVRTALTKNGGNLGASGSTAFLFDRKAQLVVKKRSNKKTEEDELDIIDSGAEDFYEISDEEIAVYCGVSLLGALRDALILKGFTVKSAELVYLPKNTVSVADESVSQQITGLIDVLEEIDDVMRVFHNAVV